MSQVWISTLLMFLGLNLGIYFLGGAMLPYDPSYTTAYNESQKLLSNVTGSGIGSGTGLWEYLIMQFLNPVVLGAIAGAAVIGRFVGGTNNIALLAAFSAALVGWFLNPISVISAMHLPSPVGLILFVIMQALVLITVVDFVRG